MTEFHTTEIEMSCPICGTLCSSITGTAAPKPGMWLICAHCENVGVINDTSDGLRPPSPTELTSIMASSNYAHGIQMLRLFKLVGRHLLADDDEAT